MADHGFLVIPLHIRWDLLESCVELVNSEWKRNSEVRAHSLRKCSENFPISLVMIRKSNDTQLNPDAVVVGHSRLSSIPGKPGACWLESVVVDKSQRGKGYGKILMAETENYAKSRGFSELFLSTHDAQEFYKAIGYIFCAPVVTMGSACNLLQKTQAFGLLQKMSLSNSSLSTINKSDGNVISPDYQPMETSVDMERSPGPIGCNPPRESSSDNASPAKTAAIYSPPPPPPPPQAILRAGKCPTIDHHPSITVFYMTKRI